MLTEKGLPCSVESERAILGTILLDDSSFAETVGLLAPDDFSIERNRRVFRRMGELYERGEQINTVTVAHELEKNGEFEPDTLSHLNSLSDGIPIVSSVDGYIRILREKSALRRIIFASQQAMNRAFAGDSNADEIIEESRLATEDINQDGGKDAADTLSGIIEEAGGISEFFAPKRGVKTAWYEVNEATSGWNRGELYIIAARPSMGKTAFALNAFLHAVRLGVPSVFYSVEMTREAIVKRLVSLITLIPYMELQSGRMCREERTQVADAMDELAALPMRIYGAAGKTVLVIRNHMGRMHRKGLCKFAMVDYIGLIRGSDKNENRNRELGDICRQLKIAAGELNIPLVLLAQLNRAVESRNDKRPMLSDLRDSGELEEHADMVGFIHRPEYYSRDDESLKGVAEFIIAKQRNGPTPIIGLKFDYRGGKFDDGIPEENRRV